MVAGGRRGLFEYLAEAVPTDDSFGTRHTEADGETYDDDPGIGGLSLPARCDVTVHTRVESETYDDDPGIVPLGLPACETTRITKVDGETYDDDPGIRGLSFPL